MEVNLINKFDETCLKELEILDKKYSYYSLSGLNDKRIGM